MITYHSANEVNEVKIWSENLTEIECEYEVLLFPKREYQNISNLHTVRQKPL